MSVRVLCLALLRATIFVSYQTDMTMVDMFSYLSQHWLELRARQILGRQVCEIKEE